MSGTTKVAGVEGGAGGAERGGFERPAGSEEKMTPQETMSLKRRRLAEFGAVCGGLPAGLNAPAKPNA